MHTAEQTMTTPIIHAAAASDETPVIDVMVQAFSADPAARWTWPDPALYRRHFPEFVKAFAGRAFTHGSAYYVEGYAGAALWLPPGVHPDEDALTSLFQRTTLAQNQTDVFALLEQMGRFHPEAPHWYLPLIGVAPSQHGKGYGSALMKHALVPCDRDGRLAYLESTNPRNIPLYERHGFEVIGTIQAGTSSPLFPMLRRPEK
jgi:ribosomal protein S18 acetylase RimI-like enzyme